MWLIGFVAAAGLVAWVSYRAGRRRAPKVVLKHVRVEFDPGAEPAAEMHLGRLQMSRAQRN